ncbi:hypothetical protein WJX73_006392 [Symbiochloris irregularis]|uniref:Stress-associated endoplasmic reticulum protein n=1 Tax=Symbiochloris irregularis TaxID=706552 RepID=A0AAW1NIQ8_9CHLO
MSSQFMGTSLSPATTRRPVGARQPLRVQALFKNFGKRPDSSLSKKDRNTIKRGEQGQVKKAGKLLPKKEGYLDKKVENSRKMFNARNLNREGGAAGGAPYQKINKNTPGYRGIPKQIDPLIYTGGLIAVFVVLAVGLAVQG